MSDNPPAFPINTTGQLEPSDGMTLRDWFAGQALAGGITGTDKMRAERAYLIADAMLAERSKS